MIKNPALGNLGNTSGEAFLGKLLPRLVTLALIIGAVIFFFNLIMGAIQWISSGGDKQKLESARGRISSALIGLVILLSVFAVAIFIENFFHISILTLDIGKLIIQ